MRKITPAGDKVGGGDAICNTPLLPKRYEMSMNVALQKGGQAIVAHVLVQWIHPFGDGNGRAGRLVEYNLCFEKESPTLLRACFRTIRT